jgi:hypothetical protein
MRRRYRFSGKLSAQRRQRVARVLATPVMLRAILPAFATMLAFILIVLGVVRSRWPHVDINGWTFITAVMSAATVVCFAAWAVAHVFLVRWLIRYRSARHGREVAMGDVLRTTDVRAPRWRRFELAAYGVSDADRAAFDESRRSGAA